MTNLICIVCPKGCHLAVDEDNNYEVTGFGCARGVDYGKKELQSPREQFQNSDRDHGVGSLMSATCGVN